MTRFKKREEAVEPEETAQQEKPAEPSNEELEAKRNELINIIKPLLVTKRQMVEGGRIIRSKVSQEQAYLPVIVEINEIGKKLGHAEVSLGMLRRD